MALDRGGSKGSLDRENHEAEPSGFRDPNYPRAPRARAIMSGDVVARPQRPSIDFVMHRISEKYCKK